MENEKLKRPVWAEIHLDSLRDNFLQVKQHMEKETQIWAVIKADGYGHGARAIGKTLVDSGAYGFAVATLSEGIELREHYPETPILILGYTPDEYFEDLIQFNLIQTLYTYSQCCMLNTMAKKLHCRVKVHIKVDTGMNRLGFLIDDETFDEMMKIVELENLDLEGIYTHFFEADNEESHSAVNQMKKFEDFLQKLKGKGIEFKFIHASNSAAIMRFPTFQKNMVRAGIMLYGLSPFEESERYGFKLKEVMTLKARISHVKCVGKGEGIGYGHTYYTPRATKVATIPIGYADGLSRKLSNRGFVLVKGVKCPIIGNVCMDQTMIDVTDVEAVERGEIVVLFGEQLGQCISISEYARWMETIHYEVVTSISKRVPRVYLNGGSLVEVISDYTSISRN